MADVATKTKTEIEPKLEQREKKAALIVASKDFKDEEYFVPREVLEKAGIRVVTVSDSEGKAQGADGGEVKADLTLDELRVEDFEIVAFIGGPGALDHLDVEQSYEIAKRTLAKGKVLGAICIAPVILAKAGVLEEKEATVWSSSMDKSSIETIEEQGANYHERSVVMDDRIITADGPESAKKFSRVLLHALTKS